jgi:hypothetical protein
LFLPSSRRHINPGFERHKTLSVAPIKGCVKSHLRESNHRADETHASGGLEESAKLGK